MRDTFTFLCWFREIDSSLLTVLRQLLSLYNCLTCLTLVLGELTTLLSNFELNLFNFEPPFGEIIILSFVMLLSSSSLTLIFFSDIIVAWLRCAFPTVWSS